MMDCEFCDLPLTEHDRYDGTGTWLDGMLIHRIVLAPEAFDAFVTRLDGD